MQDTKTTLDSKSLAIGVLSITACILFVGFLFVSSTGNAAYAIGQNDVSGDYKVLTQQLTSSREGIVVLDAAAKRLIIYEFDFSRKQLFARNGFELEQLQKPPDPGGQPGQRNRRNP